MKSLIKVVSVLMLISMLVLSGCNSQKTSGKTAASNYPNKTIQLVVPWGAGGDTDVIMRLIAKGLQKELGQTVVVKNVSGGGGTIGAKQAMGAKPDGYTLLAGHDSIAMSHLTGVTKFGYFDFQPISLMTSTYDIVATSSDNKWKNMKDVVADAKANPGKLTFGATIGSTSQLTPVMIQTSSGIKFNIVGYQGTAKRMQAIIGKQIDFGSVSVAAGSQYLKAGKMTLLGIASDKRDPAIPNVPTLKEQGIDVISGTNRGIFAPKGTPSVIVKKISDALKKVANSKDFQSQMEKLGTKIQYKNYQDYATFLKANQKSMEQALKENGLLKK